MTAEGLAAIRATAGPAPAGPRRLPGDGGISRRRGPHLGGRPAIAQRYSGRLAARVRDGGPGLGRCSSCTGRLRRCHRPALTESQGQAVYLGQCGNDGPGRPGPPTWTGPRPSSSDSRPASCRPGEGFSGPSGRVGMAQDLARRRGAARADGRRSVAVGPDAGAVHRKEALARGAVARY